MYAFTGHLKAKEGSAEIVRTALLAMIEPSRAEPGCILYLPHVVDADAGEFMIYERYDDEAAFEAHRQSKHCQEWVTGLIVPNLESRERRECTPLEP